MKMLFDKFNKNSIKTHIINNKTTLVVFIFGCIVTFVFAYFRYIDEKKHQQFEFELVCNEIQTKIFTRLHSHALLLRNASSFYSSSDTITRAEWKHFYRNSNIEKNLPGIQGVGFSLLVHKDNLQKHIQQIQKEGFPTYTISPSFSRDVYTSIIFLEPFNSRNLRAFGYDMFSEPTRRQAMVIARDSNTAALSGKVLLKQETNKDIQIGTLMYVPVYKKNMPITTVTQRRKALVGWAYSPYRMNDLMKGILGGWHEKTVEQIHLQMFDNNANNSKQLLYDSNLKNCEKHHDTQMLYKTTINFNNKKLLLVFSKTNETLHNLYFDVILILCFGILISFLLYRLILSLAISKKRIQLANQLTIELLDSEFKFKTVADFTYEWEYWEGVQGEILYMSPSCERISGYTVEEFMNNSQLLKDIIHPDDRKVMNAHFEYIHLNKDSLDVEKLEFRIIKKNGEIAYIGHLCTAVYKNNVHLGRRVSNRDITNRKLAEDARNETKALLTSIIDSTDDLIWAFEIEHLQLLAFNSSVERHFKKAGISIKKGMHLEDFFNPEYVETWYSFFWKTISQKQFVTEYNSSIGNKLLFLNMHVIYKDEKPFAISIFSKDITNAKKAELALQESEIKFKNIFNVSSDGILLINMDLKVVKINETLQNILGYSEQEVQDKSVFDYVPSQYKDVIKHSVVTLIEKGSIIPIEIEIFHKSKQLFPAEINTKLIMYDKQQIILAIVRDISERKKHEKEIFNSIAITEEKEKQAFAKELHDGLGPILSTCKIYMATVKNKLNDNPELFPLSNRALELLDNGLITIKEVSNKLSPHILRNFGLQHALQAFVANLNLVSHIQFNCISNFETRLPEVVEFAMYRILTELINNTLKYAEATSIDIHLGLKNNLLHIEYSDNGIGFDFEEIISKKQGFGILNIENRIKMMNGEFTYITAKNNGVHVRITIDLQKI